MIATFFDVVIWTTASWACIASFGFGMPAPLADFAFVSLFETGVLLLFSSLVRVDDFGVYGFDIIKIHARITLYCAFPSMAECLRTVPVNLINLRNCNIVLFGDSMHHSLWNAQVIIRKIRYAEFLNQIVEFTLAIRVSTDFALDEFEFIAPFFQRLDAV